MTLFPGRQDRYTEEDVDGRLFRKLLEIMFDTTRPNYDAGQDLVAMLAEANSPEAVREWIESEGGK